MHGKGESVLNGWLGIVLTAPDVHELAHFYRDLLEIPLTVDQPNWCLLSIPGSKVNLAFQVEEAYERPTWPARPGDQQMMAHLDIGVTDLQAAIDRALSLGATLHPHQPHASVRVMLDPAGHPFCLDGPAE